MLLIELFLFNNQAVERPTDQLFFIVYTSTVEKTSPPRKSFGSPYLASDCRADSVQYRCKYPDTVW
jgi:hypothetical protein